MGIYVCGADSPKFILVLLNIIFFLLSLLATSTFMRLLCIWLHLFSGIVHYARKRQAHKHFIQDCRVQQQHISII